jgi:hypothetical protein
MNESSETLRSDIDTTRRKMDETMDAIGDRLHGRHLLDEVLGFFRQNGRSREAGRKLANAAESAVHAITDTVKRNPGPALLVGAGVAWFIYSATRNSSADEWDEDSSTDSDYRDDLTRTETVPNDPDLYYDRPLDYPSGDLEAGEQAAGNTSKFAEAKNAIRDKASNLKERSREKLADVGARAREKLDQARHRTQEVYARSRERVTSTFQQHPLEIGLGCLAVGFTAGLALPTPARLNRTAGPAIDRLRQRARRAGSQLVDKTTRVGRAAAEAAQEEAHAQGLVPGATERATAESSPVGNLSGSIEPNPSVGGSTL